MRPKHNTDYVFIIKIFRSINAVTFPLARYETTTEKIYTAKISINFHRIANTYLEILYFLIIKQTEFK